MIMPDEPASGPAPVNVLIVDDSPANLLALEALLEPLGTRLVRANSGREALAAIERERFALILLDVVMPGLDGFATAQRIRASPTREPVPIIFLTANDGDSAAAYALGASDILRKPLDPAALVAKVSVFVELARSHARVEALLRERAARELRASGEQLDVILRGVADGLTAQTPDGRIVFANPAAARLLGFATTDAMMATPVDEIMRRFEVLDEHGHPFDLERLPSRAAMRGETPPEMIIRFRHSETHEERWSVSRSTPAFGTDGEVRLVINFFRDITDSVRAAASLRVQQAWFETTLKSIGDAVIATDAAGRVTFMNAVAIALTGWTLEDAKGEPLTRVFEIVNEHTRATVESPVDKVIREGRIVGLANHTILIGRDGLERSIADSGAPIRDDEGGLAGVVLVFRDVSEDRRAQQREQFLVAASRLLSDSLDYATTLASVARLAVPDVADWCSVAILEPDGKLRQLEVAHSEPAKVEWARQLATRYPADDNASTGAAHVARTGLSELVAEIPDALLVAAARDPEHLELLRAVGFTSYMCVPLTAHGKVLGVITFVAAESRQRYGPADLDFAEELARRAATAIDNAILYRDARESNRMKDEFLSTISHELRTPLTAILGWAHMLRTGRGDPARAIEIIERNAAALARIVEDILDVSRIITGKLGVEPRRIDLGAVIQESIEAMRPAADAKGVRVEVALDPVATPASGDPDRLQQVVWNLVSNAIKFTPRGGTVRVDLDRVDSNARIRVRDTGQGIEPEFLPHVFERFRQADSRTTRKHGGLGLGLAIVRHLVELHGGQIAAESAGEGKGATFTILLPIRAAMPSSEPPPSGRISPAPERRAADRLDGVRVLIVDDEEDARELLALILKDRGAEVTAAASVRDAIAAIERRPPDVLVSDIGMPGEDGFALIAEIRSGATGSGPWIPAVALTAYAGTEDRRRVLAAGFQFHLSKPVDSLELIGVVADLARNRDRRE